MDHGVVGDARLFADDRRVARAAVHHGAILDVRAGAYFGVSRIAADDGAVPDRRVLVDGDIADNAGRGRDEGRRMDAGTLSPTAKMGIRTPAAGVIGS